MPFPYDFPITFETGYFVEADWDNDGTFTASNDDLTGDIKNIAFSRGKSDELGKAEVGQLSITLNNSSGLYSPPNSAGALSGKLLPKRPIRVYHSTDGTTRPLFYGFIEEIIPHPNFSEQDCVITAVDGLDYLSRQELDSVLYKDQLTGTLVGNILDDAGWSSTDRSIDAGQDTVPFGYWHAVMARFALGEIEDSELGFIYINCSGDLVYEDRHHRYTATHQTSQATFNNTMTNVTYSMNPSRIYNIARATVTPWDLSASVEELWRLQEVSKIDAGQTETWWGDSSVSGSPVFVDTWTTPAASTDYTANSASTGAGDDETANVTVSVTKFAQSIKLAITNSASHSVYMTLLKARGTYYDDQTKVSRKSEDSTSQTAYQKRTLPLDGKYLTDADKAQDFCDYAVGRYKDPQGQITMTIVNSTSTNLVQQLTRELSDRITVVNSKLGINGDFFIDAMEHEITESGKLHVTTYTLKSASNEDFWCLDYSALGTGTKLAY